MPVGARARVVERLLALALALAVLAPMVLGPSLAHLTRALGGLDEHRCACGMIPGTCGCPECARLEHERVKERAPSRVPTLRTRCDDDEVAARLSQLPVALPSPVVEALIAPASDAPGRALARPALHSVSREPPVPPPRRALA